MSKKALVGVACLVGLMGFNSASSQTVQSEDSRKSLQAQAERAQVIYQRGKRAHYTQKFDLSQLPEYVPGPQLSGWIRLSGNNYLVDGSLGEYWLNEFAKHQPGIRISTYLPTAAVAFSALFHGQADLSMGHKPGFYDLLAYQRVMDSDPLEFAVVTGSYDVPGWESSTAIVVNKDNPIKGVSLEELDGIFGAERDGGWAGTNFRPDWGRGPEKNIRQWGQMGMSGHWSKQDIIPYGFSLTYNTSEDFARQVMNGGDKWNEKLRGLAHIVQPDGTRIIQAEQIMSAISSNPYAIGYTRFRGPREGVRQLPVSVKKGGPYIEHTIENVQNRTYPLYNEQYFYAPHKKGDKFNPMVKEFIRFVLSRQGQTEVMRDGKYLPLTAEVVRAELKKLEGL